MILKYLFPRLILLIFVNGIFCQTDTLIIQTEINTQYIEYLTAKEIEWNNQINNTGDTDTPENMNAHMGLALIQFSKSQINILEMLTDVDLMIYNVNQHISSLNGYYANKADSILVLLDAINNEIGTNLDINIETFSDSLNIWLQINSLDILTEIGPMIYNIDHYISDLNSYLENETIPTDSIQVLFDAINNEIEVNAASAIRTLLVNLGLQVNSGEMMTDVGPMIYNVDQYISDLNSFLQNELIPIISEFEFMNLYTSEYSTSDNFKSLDSILVLFDAIANEIDANLPPAISTFSDSLNIWLQVNSWEMMTNIEPMIYNVDQYISDLNSFLHNELIPKDSILVLFDAIANEIDANLPPAISTFSDSLNIWLQVNSWEMMTDIEPMVYNVDQYILNLNSYLENETDSMKVLFDAINNEIHDNIVPTISNCIDGLYDGFSNSNFREHIEIVKNGFSNFTFNLEIQNYTSPIIINRAYFNNYNLLEMSYGMSNGIQTIADLSNEFYMNLDQIMDVALNPAYLDFSEIENELDLINMFKLSNSNWLNLTDKGIAWFHDAGAELKSAFGEIASFFRQLAYLAENSDMTLNDDLYSIIDLLEQLDNDFSNPTTSTIIDGEHVNLSAWFDYPPNSFLSLWEKIAEGNDNSLHCLFPDRSTNLNCDAECYSNEINQDECGICGGNGPNDGEDCAGNPLSIDDNLHPENYSIHSIYPNPFNPVANITYGLPAYANVQIVVYDLAGKQVQTLVNGFQNAGYYSIYWNADAYSSGMYFARMHANSIHGNEMSEYVKTKKMLLIK